MLLVCLRWHTRTGEITISSCLVCHSSHLLVGVERADVVANGDFGYAEYHRFLDWKVFAVWLGFGDEDWGLVLNKGGFRHTKPSTRPLFTSSS